MKLSHALGGLVLTSVFVGLATGNVWWGLATLTGSVTSFFVAQALS